MNSNEQQHESVPYQYVPPAPMPKPEFAVATWGNRAYDLLMDRVIVILATVAVLYIAGNFSFDMEKWKAVRMYVIVVYPLYVLVCECIWQRTVAKLLTHTKVVDVHGNKPSFLRILGRTAARYIPFNPLSFLQGKYPVGWHDRISKTLVVPAGYTPEDVRKIDFEELKKHKNTTGVVLFVLYVLLMILVISGVVWASWNAARDKASEAAALRSVATTTISGALVTEGSYFSNIYRPAEDDFSAFFPLYPKMNVYPIYTDSKTGLAYQQASYGAIDNDIIYYVTRYAFSKGEHATNNPANAEKVLAAVLEDFSKEMDEGIIDSSDYSDNGKQQTLTFLIVYPKYKSSGKVVLSNGNIYLAYVEYPSALTDRTNLNKFLNSIIIK